jgi:ribonuclease BN (tRNA processing enzyme)
VKLTVLGGCGVWPAAGEASSGYLVEHEGFRLLIDPGYAVLPQLLRYLPADDVDAVLVSHGHPDHCADVNPLLRARAIVDRPAESSIVPLPIHALPGALDSVLALDRPGMLDHAFVLREISAGEALTVGPFEIATRALPHSRPNVGIRVVAAGAALVYTGDAGPDPGLVELARDADVLLAEATYIDEVPEDSVGTLSSARDAGRQAAEAGVDRLLLTHLPPGADRDAAGRAALASFSGPIEVAKMGLTLTIGDPLADGSAGGTP